MQHLQRHIIPHLPNVPALEVRDISVRYEDVVALEHVSFALEKGSALAVVGPNGAGKSTLFQVIAGIVRPNGGEILLYGSAPSSHICVGYVPQRTRLDANFPVNVRDVVMMGRTGKIGFFRRPSRADHAAVDAALEQVDMSQLADRPIGALSGGQQQRVFLARAIAQEAEVLLLDEPLTGLDAPSQDAILAILDALRADGVTVLVATHDLHQASTRFPLVALVNRRLAAFGSAKEVLTAQNLAAAFGSHIHVVHGEGGDLLVTDSCCEGGVDGGLPEPLPALGRQPDAAVALPAWEASVDGERMHGAGHKTDSARGRTVGL